MKKASFLLLSTFSVKAVFLPSLRDSLLGFFPTCKQHALSKEGQAWIEITRMNSHIAIDSLYVQADLSVKRAPGGHP